MPCWGRPLCFPDGMLPQVLQQVNLPILTQEECLAALLTLKKPISGRTFLCTGFPDGGRDACQVGGLCQAGLPSALSSHEGLKEGRSRRWDSREGASDRRDQAKIEGLLTQPVFTREYEFRGGLLKYQNFPKDQITQEMLRMSPGFSIPEE